MLVLMTNILPQNSAPTNDGRLNATNMEETTDMQEQIKALLQTDDLHAAQLLKDLNRAGFMPDEILDVGQLDNGYYKMTFMHDVKRYTAELTRKKYLDCVRDEDGDVLFAAIY